MITLDEVFPKSKGKSFGESFIVLEVGVPKRTSSKFRLLCKVCSCEVEMKPVKVFMGQKACKCSTQYYRNSSRRLERLLTKLKDKNISSIEIPENLKWYHDISVKCNVCEYQWSTKENSLVNQDAGCPNCANVRRYTQSEVEYKLLSLLGNSKIVSYKILNAHWSSGEVDVQCVCGHSRKTTPRNAYYDCNSCMGCSESGFKSLEPAILYLLELKDTGGVLIGYKYGIAGNLSQRYKKILRGFEGLVSVWYSWDYSVGCVAQRHESIIKKALPQLLSKEILPDGFTETFSKDLLSTFLAIQQSQYEREVYY
jgi:hypothetical protein